MAIEVVDRRTDAIEKFARVLAELRDSAGRPSFRVMSGRSGCISHTTLHEAAQGNRLPTWETTVEFVRACGANPEEYQALWANAQHQVNLPGRARRGRPEGGLALVPPAEQDPAALATLAAADGPDAASAAADSGAGPTDRAQPVADDSGAGSTIASPQRSAGRTPMTRVRRAMLCCAAAVVALGGGVAWKAAEDEAGSLPTLHADTSAAGYPLPMVASPTACPVAPTNPPWAPPANVGDRAEFLGDITIPDCTNVAPRQQFTKVWRLRNLGIVPWTGRTLHRVELPQGRGHCQTVERIRVPDTRPGQQVDVQVEVTAPDRPTICVVRWMMKDDKDRVAFPGGRPVNFQVVVG